ncbi:MAG: RNA chaperone Hfq [Leptolyngbya sp. SIO1E4]|nr:RNA chaperone Hfq [Leptolyngbya sp. SIO1E4]
MSLEIETGLPSIRLLQTYLRDKRAIEVTLVTGDKIQGTLSWQDPLCLCLDADSQPILIWRSALAVVKAV